MKRPWTPGPWLRHGSHLYDEDKNIICQFASFGKWKTDSFQDLSDNLSLASKAPEMAELLIYFINTFDGMSQGITQFKVDIAKKLLKEIGYDPEDL